jgi:hypothetical protein
MGLITVFGASGCRYEEVARIAALRLQFELVTGAQLAGMLQAEIGPETPIPDKAYAHLLTSILARLVTERSLVVAADGVELALRGYPGLLRVLITAPEPVRTGNLMLDRGLERDAARDLLRAGEREQRDLRKRRFGKTALQAESYDLVLNAEKLSSDQMAEIVGASANSAGIVLHGPLSAAAEAQIQFQVRLALSKHGITPPAKAQLPRSIFAHPSEQVFANLLDFYRIPWQYEPRSFPIQWDKEGRVSEAFTPDFYLPESDLYVELTTMKQSLVTRKNRKVKLLRQMYPHINIQVFYQKDFENLIFKYGLAERRGEA